MISLAQRAPQQGATGSCQKIMQNEPSLMWRAASRRDSRAAPFIRLMRLPFATSADALAPAGSRADTGTDDVRRNSSPNRARSAPLDRVCACGPGVAERVFAA